MEEEKKDIQAQILDIAENNPEVRAAMEHPEAPEKALKSAINYAKKIIKENFPDEKEIQKLFTPGIYIELLRFVGWIPTELYGGKLKYSISPKAICAGYRDICRKMLHLFTYYDDIAKGRINEDIKDEMLPLDLYEFLIDFTDEERGAVTERRFIFWIIPAMHELKGSEDPYEDKEIEDILLADLKAWNDADKFISAVKYYGKDHHVTREIRENNLYPYTTDFTVWDVIDRISREAEERKQSQAEDTPTESPYAAEEVEEISFFDALDIPQEQEETNKKQKDKKRKPTKKEDALLPQHFATIRKTLTMSHDKISSLLPSIPVGTVNQPVRVINKTNKKKEAIALVSLESISSDKNISVDADKLSRWDMGVCDAVASLILDGNHIMSPAMIYRKYMGITDPNYTVTPNQIEEIRASMSRLQTIRVTIDHTEQSSALHRRKYDMDKTSGYLISCEERLTILNGTIVEGYVFPFDSGGSIKLPVLHRYAAFCKQLEDIPYKMLTLPVNNTVSNIELRNFLLHRIRGIKGGKISNKILFDTMYKDLKGDKISKVEKKRMRDAAFAMLDYWKKEGFIRDYQINTKGNNIIESVTILVGKTTETPAEE